jgi:hypothetical protein
MPRNVYFSHGATSEQRLYEDITIEALKIYGHDVFYIPRKIVNTDAIFNEDALSEFGDAYQIEMYVENTDGFEGEGDLLSKFGVEIRDSMALVLSTRRWEQLVGRFQNPEETRPQEGDLIYFPMVKGLFEIKFVEDESPFYQLKNLPTFKLSCEQFEYNNEAIDTGISDIDSFETDYATRTKLTLGSGTGSFVVGDEYQQTIGSVVVTAEVAEVDGNVISVYGIKASDGSNTGFAVTAGNAGNILSQTEAVAYAITGVDDGFTSIDDNDPYADNVDFETNANNFIDFTETNPFGLPNVTT